MPVGAGALPGLTVCMSLVSPLLTESTCSLLGAACFPWASGAWPVGQLCPPTGRCWAFVCLSPPFLGVLRAGQQRTGAPRVAAGESPRGQHGGNNSQWPLGLGIQSCLLPMALCGFGFLTCKVGLIVHLLRHFVKTREHMEPLAWHILVAIIIHLLNNLK